MTATLPSARTDAATPAGAGSTGSGDGWPQSAVATRSVPAPGAPVAYCASTRTVRSRPQVRPVSRADASVPGTVTAGEPSEALTTKRSGSSAGCAHVTWTSPSARSSAVTLPGTRSDGSPDPSSVGSPSSGSVPGPGSPDGSGSVAPPSVTSLPGSVAPGGRVVAPPAGSAEPGCRFSADPAGRRDAAPLGAFVGSSGVVA